MSEDQGLTLAIILTTGGAVAAAALITGVIQLVKTLFGANWPGATASRLLAFLLSAVLVVWAYVGIPVVLTAATAFAGLLAFYGIARLAMAVYDDAAGTPGGLRGPDAP